MPQMAPLMWVSLFISFLILLFFTSNKILFSKMKMMKTSPKIKMNNMPASSAWKW